jgi:hypothetical protein
MGDGVVVVEEWAGRAIDVFADVGDLLGVQGHGQSSTLNTSVPEE